LEERNGEKKMKTTLSFKEILWWEWSLDIEAIVGYIYEFVISFTFNDAI
jgi:hypothetical protein